MTELALAVDAGNSKTVAVLGDPEGTVLGFARSGCGDIYAAPGEAAAVDSVRAAIRDALDGAGAAMSSVRSAAFHLAGVDWPEDEEFWLQSLRPILPAGAAVVVRNDGFALLRCIRPDGIGAAVTVGTGPAVAARAPGGRDAAMAFWCRDAIGGWALGDQALRAVYLADYGLATQTALSAPLLALYGVTSVAELLQAMTRRGRPEPVATVASAARTVLACAQEGDAVAREIVRRQTQALSGYIAAVARSVGLSSDQDWPIVLGGSIITSEFGDFREALLEELARALPAATPVVTPAAPVLGVLLDALYELDPDTAAHAHARVLATPLPNDLFST